MYNYYLARFVKMRLNRLDLRETGDRSGLDAASEYSTHPK